eukprot:4228587-Amphidinium_carterae.1
MKGCSFFAWGGSGDAGVAKFRSCSPQPCRATLLIPEGLQHQGKVLTWAAFVLWLSTLLSASLVGDAAFLWQPFSFCIGCSIGQSSSQEIADGVKCFGDGHYSGYGDTIYRGTNSNDELGNNLPYLDLGEGINATALSAGAIAATAQTPAAFEVPARGCQPRSSRL